MTEYIIYSGEETDLLGRRISNNLCRYSALKRLEHNLHSLSVSCISDIFPKMTDREKPDKCHFSQVITVNINNDKSC